MLSFLSNRNLSRAAVVAGLLSASVAWGQEDERSSYAGGVYSEIQFPGGTLESFVSHLQAEAQRSIAKRYIGRTNGDFPAPEVHFNVLYRGGAEAAEVPPIHLKNIELQTALASSIYGTSIRFETIVGTPGTSGSDVYVFSDSNQLDSAVANDENYTTKILPVANLFGGSKEMDEVLEAIDAAVFDERHPRRQPDIRYHKPSGLLIVRGTKSQVDIVSAVVDQMDARSSRELQQRQNFKRNLNRLESRIAQYQIELGVVVRNREASEAMLKEIVMQHDAGIVTKRNVDEAGLEADQASAKVQLVALNLRTTEAELKLYNSRYDEDQSSKTYEYGTMSGASKSLVAVVSAMRLLEGPPIGIESAEEGKITLKASEAEHAVIAAVLDAMKIASGQGQE